MSKSKVCGERLAYESPTARIVAVESGCVVRASVWTAAPFDPTDGMWDDGNATANEFEMGPFPGLWCDDDNSSSAAAFVLPPTNGEWVGSDGGVTAKAFEENTGQW